MVKNPWIPAPLYVNKEEEEKIEKINEDLPINQVNIKIGKITHPVTNIYLNFLFQLSNEKSIVEYLTKPENQTYFNYQNNIKLDKTEYNYLHRKNIKLTLIEKQGFCCFKKDVPVGECLIKFDPFKSSSIIEGEFEFKTIQAEGGNENSNSSNISGSKIFFSAKIRSALVNKEYIMVSKTGLAVTRTFPPFKGENVHGIIDEENRPVEINKNLKVVKKEIDFEDKQPKVDKKKKINASPNKEKNSQQKKLPEMNVEFKMSDFKQEELENPDFIDNLVSLKVLEFKIKKTDEEIQKIEGRAPPKLREKILKMKVKKNVSNIGIIILFFLGY
jgi:hypothetical protein